MDSFLRINDARPLTNRDYLTVMNDDSETRVGNEQRSRGNLGQQDNETEGESHRFSRSIIYTRNGKRARRIPQFSSVRAPGWERGEKKTEKEEKKKPRARRETFEERMKREYADGSPSEYQQSAIPLMPNAWQSGRSGFGNSTFLSLLLPSLRARFLRFPLSRTLNVPQSRWIAFRHLMDSNISRISNDT